VDLGRPPIVGLVEPDRELARIAGLRATLPDPVEPVPPTGHSDLVFSWQLAEAGAGTSIAVEVEIPEREAHRLPDQQRLTGASLDRLAALAVGAGN
jgi:hypothetical protein